MPGVCTIVHLDLDMSRRHLNEGPSWGISSSHPTTPLLIQCWGICSDLGNGNVGEKEMFRIKTIMGILWKGQKCHWEHHNQHSFWQAMIFYPLFKKNLLAPSGALVFIIVYYIPSNPLFQIFQILQIWKWKWRWKDPTCAIFLKSMGFKNIEYDIPVYQM